MVSNNFSIKSILFILFLSFSISVLAINCPALNDSLVCDSSAFYFDFHNANFFCNNEYFNDVVEGYTLIGYFLTPEIHYCFSPNLKVGGGIHLLKYSGLTNFSRYAPTYYVSYARGSSEFIMGTIKGTINHKMLDQMLFSEKYFTDNIENGVQYRFNNRYLFFDIWVNWQDFIFLHSKNQEKFTGGISAKPYIINNKKWEVSTPCSFLGTHRGGQINDTKLPVKTTINYSFGLKAVKKLPLNYLEYVSIESHYLHYLDNASSESLYNDGLGLSNIIGFGFDNNYINLGYWFSDSFLSPAGNPMYQSFSENGDKSHQKLRRIVAVNALYSLPIFTGVNLGVSSDIYWNLISGKVNYNTGLAIIIKNSFFLKRSNRLNSKPNRG